LLHDAGVGLKHGGKNGPKSGGGKYGGKNGGATGVTELDEEELSEFTPYGVSSLTVNV